jgi:hypothetical protein
MHQNNALHAGFTAVTPGIQALQPAGAGRCAIICAALGLGTSLIEPDGTTLAQKLLHALV